MNIKENIKKLLRYPYSLIPYKYRLHPSYYSTKKFLKKNFPNDRYIEHYQLKKLKEIVVYAYKNCPGYYHLYNDSNIKPNDFNKFDDIKYFPLITKEILRDNKLIKKGDYIINLASIPAHEKGMTNMVKLSKV